MQVRVLRAGISALITRCDQWDMLDDLHCNEWTVLNVKVTDVNSWGIAIPSPNGETCPDTADTTSVNWVEIHFYGGFVDEAAPSDCPSDNSTYTSQGVARLATDICVEQDDGEYLMLSLPSYCLMVPYC